VVHVFQKATLVGVGTLYLILAGRFMLEGVGGGGGGLASHLGGPDAKAIWNSAWICVSAAVVWVPVVAVHTLGDIAPVSILGTLASATTVATAVGISLAVHPVTAGARRSHPARAWCTRL
jgi:hypothetical protein